jgi:hypothetical protein
MESEGLVVSGAQKFPVTLQTRKASRVEMQTHGFEVDLIGARVDKLVLATVKSYFGSGGVAARDVDGSSEKGASRYALLNNPKVREAVLKGAAERFGFSPEAIEMRLYVGKFAGADNEARVREWCLSQVVGAGPIRVVGAEEVVSAVRGIASSSQYRDSAVLATIKVLEAAGKIVP